MIIEFPGWQIKVQDRAIGFAAHVARRFSDCVDSSLRIHVPPDELRQKGHMVVDTFLDAFVGSVVMVAVQYAGSSDIKLEEAIVNGFRHKFREMRKASLVNTERETAKALIHEEDLI